MWQDIFCMFSIGFSIGITLFVFGKLLVAVVAYSVFLKTTRGYIFFKDKD